MGVLCTIDLRQNDDTTQSIKHSGPDGAQLKCLSPCPTPTATGKGAPPPGGWIRTQLGGAGSECRHELTRNPRHHRTMVPNRAVPPPPEGGGTEGEHRRGSGKEGGRREELGHMEGHDVGLAGHGQERGLGRRRRWVRWEWPRGSTEGFSAELSP